MTQKVTSINISKVEGDKQSSEKDLIVVEEPLEIRVGHGPENNRLQDSITVTMRTPGDDEHLCLGFLFTEGLIDSVSQVLSAKYCKNSFEEDGGNNVMRVELKSGYQFNIDSARRNFYTNSSCGVCGKASIEHVKTACEKVDHKDIKIGSELILNLPKELRQTQDVFKHTGGLHACGLFDVAGNLELHKEDIGRHNALDKLIGELFIKGELPNDPKILMLSGRISFELVQKAIKAGIPVIAAVGAPSSLSVALADEFGVTLIGFLKEQSYNVYTHHERVVN